MKKLIPFIFLVIISVLGCDEIPPSVQLDKFPCDSPASPIQPRRVLIEEFTGVQCVNCPDGSALIEDLQNQYSGQVIAVSIHTGVFSAVYPQSTQDMTYPLGADVVSRLGTVIGYPSAVINQKKFSGESTRVLNQTKWAGKVATEINTAPVVGVNISNQSFDPATRQLTFDADIECYGGVKKDFNLTVLITEDSIVSAQLTSTGIIDTYTHKHVLRKFVTSLDGVQVTGLPFSNSFAVTLDPIWNEHHCHIVAFASYADINDLSVLQAAEAPAIP